MISFLKNTVIVLFLPHIKGENATICITGIWYCTFTTFYKIRIANHVLVCIARITKINSYRLTNYYQLNELQTSDKNNDLDKFVVYFLKFKIVRINHSKTQQCFLK